MKAEDQFTIVEVFAGTAFEAGMLKSMLESEDINAFLKDEFLGTIAPWWASPGGAGAVKVIISSNDAGKAKPIIEEFEKHLKSN